VAGVRYADARPLMHSGDVIAFRPTNLLARFICHWTGSDYWHVGIVRLDGERRALYEADRRQGVSFRDLAGAVPFDWLAIEGAAWGAEAEAALLRDLHKPYGLWSAIRAGFGLKAHGQQCAKYVRVVRYAMDHRFQCADTPGAVVAALLRQGAALKEVTA
jgi:hypothetical protein